MENFEVKAIRSASYPSPVWMRYLDDTCVVIEREHAQQFTDHINSLDPHIKFTNDPEKEVTLPFLVTLVKQMVAFKLVFIANPLTRTNILRLSPNTPLNTNLV